MATIDSGSVSPSSSAIWRSSPADSALLRTAILCRTPVVSTSICARSSGWFASPRMMAWGGKWRMKSAAPRSSISSACSMQCARNRSRADGSFDSKWEPSAATSTMLTFPAPAL